MEDIYLYKDEFENDCQFLRKKYYEHVSAIITDFFEEPLPDNEFHQRFLNMLNTPENYEDVYHITTEMPFYWAICIIEDRWTNNHLIKNKTNDDYRKWNNRYCIENDIITFIIQGINEETYVFNNNEGGKSIFLVKKFYEFVSSLVTDFFKQPFEYNIMNVRLINRLNALCSNGYYKDINPFIGNPPYWALSIIENKETTCVLSVEQLKLYPEFLEKFFKKNGISSFVIPESS
ncbi:hypothetical protein [Chryseobacterium indologenes]|uniref:Uncharacterized protein n=1 Tax=Chryseobacterium indologenes TaxID=253 RepID=A0A0N0ZWG4_CHRID|nr:hypothetical protein [Chryseobacterium indologenes]KPE52806.1 hypothetical protein AOB46_02075 [Chryseobacterium indologenes]